MRLAMMMLVCGVLGGCALSGTPTCNGCNDNSVRTSVDHLTR